MRNEVLRRLDGYFDGETVEEFANDEALEVEELLDLLCRVAGAVLDEAEEEARLKAALADLEWAEGQLEPMEELLQIALEEERLANDAGPPPEEFNEATVMAKEEPMSAMDIVMGWLGWNPPPEAPPVKATAPKGEFSYNTPCFTQAGEGGEEIKPHTWEPVSGGPLGPKEIWQGRQIIDQDRGGIPDPGNYQEETVTEQAVVVLTVGQTFKAPEGYVIKEYRPGRPTPIFYGSIARGRKARYQGLGSKFVLVEKAQAFPA